MRLVDSEKTRTLYPFAFQFDVVVSLLPMSRLKVRFETTNTGDRPLPYYAGHHFYFAVPHDRRADWTLHLDCAEWGQRTADGAVIREKAAQEMLRLDDPALIDRFQIGPKGNVTLHNTRTGQRLIFELDHPGSVPWYAVTTWTEAAGSDFYCICAGSRPARRKSRRSFSTAAAGELLRRAGAAHGSNSPRSQTLFGNERRPEVDD
jgi:galactose mutarotase-like enzyme